MYNNYSDPTTQLPAIDVAVATVKSVRLGVLQSVEDGLVFGSERNVQQFVDLVPHLGCGGVVGRGLGVDACRLLDARQFGVVSCGVHQEAHTSL